MHTIQSLTFKHSRSTKVSSPAVHYEIAAINRVLPVLVHKPKHDMKVIVVEVLLGALAEFGQARTARCRDASQRYRGTAAVRGPPMGSAERTLWDCKTVHRGGPCYQSARARDDGQSGAVAERAHGVDADYERRARLLDRRARQRACP